MAASSRPRKDTSVQTYRRGKGLTVRLEYDHQREIQSVFHNGVLMSSLPCPPGKVAEHVFTADDDFADAWLGEYLVKLCVVRDSARIRYTINRRNSGGEDIQWYWLARNVEPNEWAGLSDPPAFQTADDGSVICTQCRRGLVCPHCDEYVPWLDMIEKKDPDSCPPIDEHRMLQLVEEMDPVVLQGLIADEVDSRANKDTYWPLFLVQLLENAGCDVSPLFLDLRDHSQDEE